MAARKKSSKKAAKKKVAASKRPVAARKASPRKPASPHRAPPTAAARRGYELIVVAEAPPVPRGGLSLAAFAAPAGPSDPVAAAAAALGCTASRLAGPSAPGMLTAVGAPMALAVGEAPRPDLNLAIELTRYYQIDAEPRRLSALASEFRRAPGIAGAYLMPIGEPPVWPDVSVAPARARTRARTRVALAAAPTPDFSDRQAYRGAAPGGVDAIAAHGQPGGDGADVGIIDIEGNWYFMHEDLRVNSGGLIAGAVSPQQVWRDHGTAVVGVVGADQNPFGVVGIAPGATIRAASAFYLDAAGGLRYNPARALREAADALSPGDIIIVELHQAGPAANFQADPQQRGYIAIEWWPATAAAVRYAIGRGVIVVAAAGNGAQDLDAAIYDTAPAGHQFPPEWRNPFRRGAADTGSILAGAGAPLPGALIPNHGPDRSRLGFSNHGACVDAQGWGRAVATTGYGDLMGGADESRWYTAQFSGTSSATPIVVGALACVQGIRRAQGRTPLTPAQARALLRTGGSPQQAGPNAPVTQRIGPRPSVTDMLARMPP